MSEQAATGPSSVKDPTSLAYEIRRFLDFRRIEAAIPPQLRKQGIQVEEYERIGGLTNQNYKLPQGQEAVVLRLPGRGTGRFIDRSSERANQEAAARAGFTPHSLFFNGRTGVKITRYLQGAIALDAASARAPEQGLAVADLLARFHSSGIRFVKNFNVFAMAKTYERVARSRFSRFYEGFGAIRARVLGLEEGLSAVAGLPVACHNDLVPENILCTPTGLTLIDWEYSGMNDPAWDLASFLLETDSSDNEEGRFLDAYQTTRAAASLGRHVPGTGQDLRLRVEAYKMLQDYLWSLWSLLQESASREPQRARYYRSYGMSRFERSLSRLPSVESGLGIVRQSKPGRKA